MKTFLLLIAFAASTFAQTPAPSIANAPAEPSFFIAAGASYNSVGDPKTAGWTSAAFAITKGLYSITTIDETRTSQSLRTGIAKALWSRWNLTLMVHADGGISNLAASNTVGSFSTGGMVAYKIPKTSLYAFGVVRMIAVTSVTVRPIYELGFGWGF